MAAQDIRSIAWSEVQDWVRALVSATVQFDCIVGISRGGVVPAVLLSYFSSDKPLAFAYRNEAPGTRDPFYVFSVGREERLRQNRDRFRITDGFVPRRPLVVDDVATFGDTLSVVEERLRELGADDVSFATYAADIRVLQRERPHLLEKLRYHEKIDNAQVWLSFPWHGGRQDE